MVVDSFGNNVDSGNFNDSFQNNPLYESGDYFVHASVQDSEDSSSVQFTIYPPLADIETSPILDQYYLCNGMKEINLQILNDSSYENSEF